MLQPLHFYGEPIEVQYDQPPLLEKTPPCPDRIVWRGEVFVVSELLEEWRDFERKGRYRQNMRPEHAERASTRGSWGVGRFHFRVQVRGGRVFEIIYDRSPQDAMRGKGSWMIYSEWSVE